MDIPRRTPSAGAAGAFPGGFARGALARAVPHALACGLAAILLAPAGGTGDAGAQAPPPGPELAAELSALLERSPRLPHRATAIEAVAPHAGWELGMVSWVAADGEGLTYLLQRGDKADPVVVLDREGRVVRSWGKGMYTTPHSIRLDPDGNVWTTDAKSSRVLEFSPEGTLLLEISVGGQPPECDGAFCGTTDVAFGPGGRVFIADGYRNARILEYTADGRRVREWGSAGTGPGELRLPHSLVVDEEGIVYVADRENGRVQRFDMEGNFLGEWNRYGKTFTLDLSPGSLWLGSQQRNEPNLSPGWVIEVDRRTGELRGYVPVAGIHGIHVGEDGELLVGPGPDQRPQRLRR